MRIHDLKIALVGLSDRGELSQFLRLLPHGWIGAMPGKGTGGIHFFVRDCRIERGRPVAVDHFWIETCLADPRGEMEELKRRVAAEPGKDGWSPPLMPTPKPFGPESEAARTTCACGRDAYVVGYKEFHHPWQAEDRTFRQALYALCLACPSLGLLAERTDPQPVELRP